MSADNEERGRMDPDGENPRREDDGQGAGRGKHPDSDTRDKSGTKNGSPSRTDQDSSKP